MKLGGYTFKRRYSLAQILVDIASAGAIVYIAFIIYACADDIERIKSLNRTDADMSVFDWRPLIIWIAAAILIFCFSFFLIFRKKKLPKKLTINEHNAVKYCNIIDTCISCVRLVTLLTISELCYLHSAAIRMFDPGFPTQLLLDVLIAAGIIIFTRMRLTAISDAEEEREEKDKKRTIIED